MLKINWKWARKWLKLIENKKISLNMLKLHWKWARKLLKLVENKKRSPNMLKIHWKWTRKWQKLAKNKKISPNILKINWKWARKWLKLFKNKIISHCLKRNEKPNLWIHHVLTISQKTVFAYDKIAMNRRKPFKTQKQTLIHTRKFTKQSSKKIQK